MESNAERLTARRRVVHPNMSYYFFALSNTYHLTLRNPDPKCLRLRHQRPWRRVYYKLKSNRNRRRILACHTEERRNDRPVVSSPSYVAYLVLMSRVMLYLAPVCLYCFTLQCCTLRSTWYRVLLYLVLLYRFLQLCTFYRCTWYFLLADTTRVESLKTRWTTTRWLCTTAPRTTRVKRTGPFTLPTALKPTSASRR